MSATIRWVVWGPQPGQLFSQLHENERDAIGHIVMRRGEEGRGRSISSEWNRLKAEGYCTAQIEIEAPKKEEAKRA